MSDNKYPKKEEETNFEKLNKEIAKEQTDSLSTFKSSDYSKKSNDVKNLAKKFHSQLAKVTSERDFYKSLNESEFMKKKDAIIYAHEIAQQPVVVFEMYFDSLVDFVVQVNKEYNENFICKTKLTTNGSNKSVKEALDKKGDLTNGEKNSYRSHIHISSIAVIQDRLSKSRISKRSLCQLANISLETLNNWLKYSSTFEKAWTAWSQNFLTHMEKLDYENMVNDPSRVKKFVLNQNKDLSDKEGESQSDEDKQMQGVFKLVADMTKSKGIQRIGISQKNEKGDETRIAIEKEKESDVDVFLKKVNKKKE